jgi:hypothetical protein
VEVRLLAELRLALRFLLALGGYLGSVDQLHAG